MHLMKHYDIHGDKTDVKYQCATRVMCVYACCFALNRAAACALNRTHTILWISKQLTHH